MSPEKLFLSSKLNVLITTALVIITAVISYIGWQKPEYYQKGIHYPYREKHHNEYWRSLTGGFLHANTTHLLVNMYMLYIFGIPIENYFAAQRGLTGSILFLLLYLFTIVFSNILTGIRHKHNPSYRSVGASGATSGILFIYILLDPWQMFLFPPLPAIVLAIGYLVYSTWASRNSNDNIDHMAHYYGAICGVLFAILFFPETLNIFISRIVNDFPL